VQIAIIAVAFILTCGAIAKDWRGNGRYDTGFGGDFAPFYCSGAVMLAHGDPYSSRDLASCGGRRGYALAYVPPTQRFEPAPLPGYDVSLFALFALLPYRVAALLWFAVSALVLLAGVAAMSAITRAPPIVAYASIAVLGAFYDLDWGQLPPIAIGAVAVAGWCVEQRRYWSAGFVAALSLIEPNIGVPAVLAICIWLPQARLATLAATAFLAICTLPAVGTAGDALYIQRIVPLQADAEAPNAIQYSATWILHVLGMNDSLALRVGSWQYLAMVALGCAIAPRVARFSGSPAAIVYLPPALAVIGGPYVHIFQMLAVVPILLLLAERTVGRLRPAFWLALVLVALSWKWNVLRPFFVLPALAVCVMTWEAMRPHPGGLRVVAMVCAVALVAIVNVGIYHAPNRLFRAAESAQAYERRIGDARELSPAIAGVNTRANVVTAESTLRMLAQKVPTSFGLLIFLGAVMAIALTPSGGRSARPEPQGL
jgi:hypothetical protein